MLAATQDLNHVQTGGLSSWRRVPGSLSLLAWALLLAPPGRAADAGRPGGLLVRVPSPITHSAVSEIKNKTHGPAQKGKIKTILFDFTAEGPNRTADFSPCQDLFYYLLELRGQVRTVAFLHDEVSGHAVLPVLACSELVMGTTATLGDVAGVPPKPLTDPRIPDTYRRAADIRDKNSPVLVMKMLNKDLEVYRGKEGRYKALSEIKEGERGVLYKPVDELHGFSRYTADSAFSVGLCRGRSNTVKELLREEDLPESILHEGISAGPKNAWLIEFSGEVTQANIDSIETKIRTAVHRGGNLIILQLECQGGEPQVARDFAEKLRTLKDDKGEHPVETVAYIPPKHRLGAGTALALACTEIIMGKDAVLCDFGSLQRQGDLAMMGKSLEDLAQKQNYPPLLIRGTVERDLVIYLVHGKKSPRPHFLVSEDEFKQDQEKQPRWVLIKVVKQKGDYLTLDAQTALENELAREVVDDLKDAYPRLGIDSDKVQRLGPGLLDQLRVFLQDPKVGLVLVMVGIIGLILEMKMPGLGIPGVIAAVCFVLYFWSQSRVSGEFVWLAVLLFVLGLILIGLEVFVMPGMAVFGISGVVLVVFSLVLVTLAKAPTTSREWWDLGGTLAMYSLSLVGGLVFAVLIARYLPQIPYANRLVLKPPTEPGDASGEDRTASPYLALLGAIGEAATNLRPAGKARFGDEYVDVMAEGNYILAGQRVQVIEIEGNRIVVKEV